MKSVLMNSLEQVTIVIRLPEINIAKLLKYSSAKLNFQNQKVRIHINPMQKALRWRVVLCLVG